MDTNRDDGFDVRELGAIFASVVLALLALPIGQTIRLTIGCALAVGLMAERASGMFRGRSLDGASAVWFGASMSWLAVAGVAGEESGLSLIWLVGFCGLVMFGASTVRWFGPDVAIRVLFTGLSVPVGVALVSIAGPVLADRLFDVSDRVVLTKDMAAFFAVVMALLARFSPALRSLPRSLAIGTYAAALIVVVASNSRSMAVAALAAFVYGLLQAKRTRLVAGLGLAGLVLWGVSVSVLGVDAGGVFDLVSSDVAEGGGRDNLWAAAWAALVDRPLFGFGLGTHVDVLLEYRLESLFGIKNETTHNMWLFAGLAGGFPAVALLFGMLTAAARNSSPTLRVVLLTLVVFGLGDAPFETPGVVLAIFGMAAASRRVAATNPKVVRDAAGVSDHREGSTLPQRQGPLQAPTSQ